MANRYSKAKKPKVEAAKQQSTVKEAAKKRAAKTQTKKKEKKKGRLKEYLKGVRLEMKKVVWPTKKELGNYTIIVVAACAVFALAFWGIDSGFLAILRQLLGITI